MRTSSALFALCVLLTFGLTGCSSIRWEQETHKVRIQTDPRGAKIWYQDASGQHLVGDSPVDLQQKVRVGYNVFDPWWWAGAVLSAGAFGGSAYWATVAPGSDDVQQGLAIGLAIPTGLAALVFIVGAISGQVTDGDRARVESFSLDVGADKPGYKGSSLKVAFPPEREEVSLLLHRTDEAPKETGVLIGAVAVARRPPVVAVFDIHDASGRLDRKDLDQLTDYLTTCLTEARKARVVPREQLRSRLQQEKAGAYAACFEESCQIELGRAVAAEKSLSTTLLRVGKKCAVTVNLYDLKTETAERGATQEGGCALDDLMVAIKAVAAKL